VIRRAGTGTVVRDEPPPDEEPVSVGPRDDEEAEIIRYVEIEAG
jgi:hypothetical protein